MTAADKMLKKTLVASKIPSRDWDGIRAGLKERAFFSAQVENIKFLADSRDAIARTLASARTERGTLSTREDAILAIREAAAREGLERTGSGDLTDPKTRKRAALIADINSGLARGYVTHLEDLSEGAMFANPARELVRSPASHPSMPRDWERRWITAGGKMHGGRMIALVDDPIWAKISRFGCPYPPFDYNSGMIARPVPRKECLELGVITEEGLSEKLEEAGKRDAASPADFNDTLSADFPYVEGSEEYESLKDAFGDQISHENGQVMWSAEIMRDAFRNGRTVDVGKITEEARDKLNSNLAKTISDSHLVVTEEAKIGTENDVDMIPILWRHPDNVESDQEGKKATFRLDMFSGGSLSMVVDVTGENPKVTSIVRTEK